MDGSAELVQLAELLRLGAQTGRQIAVFRPRDAAEIEHLAAQVEKMADAIDEIAGRGPDPEGGTQRPN